MRRTDREVTDFNEIFGILERSDTIRLGMNGIDGGCPYVVPLSFGCETAGGKIIVYFHGASEGMKHGLIKNNPLVCVEADIFHGYTDREKATTAMYESFIGFGKAEVIRGGEAARGMDLMLIHCGYDGYEFDRGRIDETGIYKIVLDSFSGKSSLKN